jgi:GT2 family glycosyltransferase
MKLACISVTYNETHLLQAWKEYFSIYRNEIDLHVIVDNDSESAYKLLLHKTFPDSIIIEQNENGGVTQGFNTGIKYALIQENIGFIVLICPDIKFAPGSLTLMKDTLATRNEVGIIGPALYNSQNVIEGYGGRLTKHLSLRFITAPNPNTIKNEVEVDFISGGINMIKREVYETIGFQDENLFMYGDEVDFDIRTKKAGYKLLILKNAVCWHMHIFYDKSELRSELSFFLLSRNIFLLCRKHLTGITLFVGYFKILYYASLLSFNLIKARKFSRLKAHLNGIWKGINNNNTIPSIYMKSKY